MKNDGAVKAALDKGVDYSAPFFLAKTHVDATARLFRS